MTDIMAGIATALDITKKLRDLNKKAGEAEFKMFLADLTLALGDAKLEVGNLKSDLADLRQQNASLQAKLEERENDAPAIEDGAYFFSGDHSRHYCTACYDTKQLKVLLRENEKHFQSFGRWICPACKANFGAANPMPFKSASAPSALNSKKLAY